MSAFDVTIKNMRNSINSLSAGQVVVSVAQPQNPSEGQHSFLILQ